MPTLIVTHGSFAIPDPVLSDSTVLTGRRSSYIAGLFVFHSAMSLSCPKHDSYCISGALKCALTCRSIRLGDCLAQALRYTFVHM